MKDTRITLTEQTDYRQLIRDNYGVKEHNITKMYEPLGYNINDFDVAFWLHSLHMASCEEKLHIYQ